MKGWNWHLDISKPDPINLESVGKTRRYWICTVNYDRDGVTFDGPAVICIDLQSETASWLDR